LEPPAAEHERWTIRNGPTAGPLVFARLYLPGFRITLDDVPLETYANHGFLLAARLPAASAGILRLDFVEPTRMACLALAGLGACGALSMFALLWIRQRGRTRRRATPDPSAST
jgi:hypothetical protein